LEIEVSSKQWTQKTAKFSWDTILDFSVSMVQQTTMELAPVIWTTMTLIAADSDRAAGLK